jgi:hypothetical protein
MNNTEGRMLPVMANAIAAFRHAPEWGRVLAFNEFAHGTAELKPARWGIVPKGEWTDHEDRLAAEWLQKQRRQQRRRQQRIQRELSAELREGLSR